MGLGKVLGAYKDPKSYIALLKMPELFIELYRRANTVFEVVRAACSEREERNMTPFLERAASQPANQPA